MECPICWSENKHKLIKCLSCGDVNGCVTCTKRHLLGNILAAKCAKCRVPWSLNDIRSLMGASFHKSFLEKYKKALLEQEQKGIDKFGYLLNDLNRMKKNEERLIELKKEYNKVLKNQQELHERIHALPPPINQSFRCPNEDGGWVDEEGEYCTVCGEDICPLCIKCVSPTEAHECKKEEKDFIDHLRQTTRPCPNCKVRFEKKAGCDIMYCIDCNHPFRWSTGESIEGFFHNPEHSKLIEEGKIQIKDENRDHLGFILLNNLPPFPPAANPISAFYSFIHMMANNISEEEVKLNGKIRVIKAKFFGEFITLGDFSNEIVTLSQNKEEITAALRLIYEEKGNIEEMFYLIRMNEDIIPDLVGAVNEKVKNFYRSNNKYLVQQMAGILMDLQDVIM